jgi:hypothetical protein
MSLVEVNWTPDQRQLKQFALLWIGFFGLIGAYCKWANGAPQAALVFWIVAAIGFPLYLVPRMTRPIYIIWMALALPVGWIVSHFILVVVFYCIVTPIALVMRFVGYDPMDRTFDRAALTYWKVCESREEAAQYFKQY